MSKPIAEQAVAGVQKLLKVHAWECKRRRVLELVMAHLAQEHNLKNEIEALELHYIQAVNGLGDDLSLDLSPKGGGVKARYGFRS